MNTITHLCLAVILLLFGLTEPRAVRQVPAKTLVLPNFTAKKIEFNAKTPGLLKTGIRLKKDDYVYFDAEGKIDLGPFHRNADAGGMLAPDLVTKYNIVDDDMNHGRLFAQVGSEIVPIQKWSGATLKEAVCNLSDYFLNMRANYFVSNQDTELTFFLNDNQPENNSGKFCIRVLIIPHSVHRSRNQYNRCPEEEPKIDYTKMNYPCPFPGAQAVDFKGLVWVISKNEGFYHGFRNNTYRGVSKDVVGCQCTYSLKSGRLVTDQYVGTFDFAFAQKRLPNPPPDDLMSWQHVAIDVWPHDAYSERSQYDPTPAENIYKK